MERAQYFSGNVNSGGFPFIPIWSHDPCERSQAVAQMIPIWSCLFATVIISHACYLENKMALTRRQLLIILLLRRRLKNLFGRKTILGNSQLFLSPPFLTSVSFSFHFSFRDYLRMGALQQKYWFSRAPQTKIKMHLTDKN